MASVDSFRQPGLEAAVAAASDSISAAGPLERRVQSARRATLASLLDVTFRAFQRVVVHGRQGYSGRRMSP